jgi:hypothetical protein
VRRVGIMGCVAICCTMHGSLHLPTLWVLHMPPCRFTLTLRTATQQSTSWRHLQGSTRS